MIAIKKGVPVEALTGRQPRLALQQSRQKSPQSECGWDQCAPPALTFLISSGSTLRER